VPDLNSVRRLAPALLAGFFTFTAAPLHAEDAVTAIKAGQLLNPVDGSLTRNAVIVIRNDRVEQVGAGAAIPAGATIIDLSA
jgi:imidazolonepropionase-like amidohydrolase